MRKNGAGYPDWVSGFLDSLRRQARTGGANIKVAAECAPISEQNVHKFRVSKSQLGQQFRADVDVVLLQARVVREAQLRRLKLRRAMENEELFGS